MGHGGEATLTWKEAAELFKYDGASGKLLWWCRRPGVRPGTEAGFMFNGTKYVTVNGVRVMVKNIVWLLNTNRWPASRVYHIDGRRDNCRFDNLSLQKTKRNAGTGEVRIIPAGSAGYRLVFAGKTVAVEKDIEKILSASRALLVY